MKELEVAAEHFGDASVDLTYENFRIEDVMKAVLPEGIQEE